MEVLLTVSSDFTRNTSSPALKKVHLYKNLLSCPFCMYIFLNNVSSMFLTHYVPLHMPTIQHQYSGVHYVTCRTSMAHTQPGSAGFFSRGTKLLEPDYTVGFTRPAWLSKPLNNFCLLLRSHNVLVPLLAECLVSVAPVQEKLKFQ